MGTISKEILSGSTNGKPLQITATGSTGTIIHTTLASSTILDEVWLYAVNTAATQTSLTIEYGGTGTSNEIQIGIPSKSGLSIVLAGTILKGDGAVGSVIRGYASVGSVINVVGYVNRINP
jgi:hypothetical protein